MNLNNFFKELKRRKVIRETIAYIIIAWVILQASTILLPIFNAPDWIIKTLTIVLIAGVPIAMVISWLYEITDKGIRRTSELNEEQIEKSERRLNVLIIVAGIIAIALFFIVGSQVKNLDAPNEYSIAILPFKDLSPEKDKTQLIDGIRENILDRLQKIEGMDPRSNRSSEAATLDKYTLKDIASKLDVKYMLEGSVQTTDNQTILSVQLWNDQDELVWEDEYPNSFEDYFKLQKLVSRDVVDAMEFEVGPRDNDILEASETQNLDAYLLVLKSIRLIHNNKPLQAVPVLSEVLQLDSNYANAYGVLAYAYASWAWHYKENPQKYIELVDENAKKAFNIDPNNTYANLAMNVIYHVILDKNDIAFNYLNKALEVNPNDPLVHYHTGQAYYFNRERDLNKSLIHFKRAYELEPLEMKNIRELMRIYTRLERYEEAEALLPQLAMVTNEESAERLKADIESFRIKDWSPEIDLLKKRTIVDSLNPDRFSSLAIRYDYYWDDNKAFLENAKRAYELDSTRIVHYVSALLENKMFDEARALIDSKNCPEDKRIGLKHQYYWDTNQFDHLKNLIDTTDWAKDPINYIWYKAKAGLIKSVDSIENYKYYQFSIFERAQLFALLGNRDSLYYYLNHPRAEEFLRINSSPDMDPYRDEPEYKAFQEKYFLKSVDW